MPPRRVAFAVEQCDRLDRAIAAAPVGVSRRRARVLIAAGAVFVDGHRCRVAGREVSAGARVVVHLEPDLSTSSTLTPRTTSSTREAPESQRTGEQNAPAVLWRAGDLFAVRKPPGLHVNETETSSRTSLVSLFDGPVFPVHRLDRDTSGVLLLASTSAAASEAAALFAARQVVKIYWAVARGTPTQTRIDAPIGLDRRRPRARAIRQDGKASITEVEVLGSLGSGGDLVGIEARPLTGRTHQVRVHLAYVGSPIAGDLLYGGPAASRVQGEIVRWPRVMLHAAALGFRWRGQDVWLTAPRPDDFGMAQRLGLPEEALPRNLGT